LVLWQNITGDNNTALGYYSLYSNTTGADNTAVGAFALSYSSTGNDNTAVGEAAMESNAGDNNTAIGSGALFANATGNNNTAIGALALPINTTGSNNIALGDSAGFNLTTGSNNIDIGNSGFAAESNTIRIGTRGTQTATFIAGISGVAVTGSQVVISSHGKLGVTASSEDFKKEIKPMGNASEAILALKPVTFRYKHELDPNGIPQFGLVAEEVEKVNPDLVASDEQGKPYTVRYEAINAMLLNEFLKEHKAFLEQKRKVQEQEATIVQLKSAAAKQEAKAALQQKQIEALTAGLQKVSAQLQMSKSAPRAVVTNE
jgi:hypothetical protein